MAPGHAYAPDRSFPITDWNSALITLRQTNENVPANLLVRVYFFSIVCNRTLSRSAGMVMRRGGRTMEVGSQNWVSPCGPPLVDALGQLQKARDYARNVGGDAWQFAVEWSDLASRGLDLTDIRWLVARGFVELRRELTPPGAFRRGFAELDIPRLMPDVAFVLTDGGKVFLQNLRGLPSSAATTSLPDRDPIVSGALLPEAAAERPHWDADRRELWFAGQLVKQFRVPAANQELILSAFEEEGWPQFVDDPLPRHGDEEPSRRLQATIKSLNRHQSNPLIRFRGNGGEKALWEVVGR